MTTPGATILIVETTAGEEPPHDFLGDTADIVYFISFAHTERYGADHPLAKAAAVIKRKHRISMAPLLTFADARGNIGYTLAGMVPKRDNNPGLLPAAGWNGEH